MFVAGRAEGMFGLLLIGFLGGLVVYCVRDGYIIS